MNELEEKVYEALLSCINVMLTPRTDAEIALGIKPDKELLNYLTGSLLHLTQAFATKVNAERTIKK